MGTRHTFAVPYSIHFRRGACLSISGRVEFTRETRMLLTEGSTVEIGPGSYVNCLSTITCFDHITIGATGAISWDTNILDGNAHDLTVEGVTKPRAKRVSIGDHVWIGTGAVILAGMTIGNGAVAGAGSLVSSDVPARALVAGNLAIRRGSLGETSPGRTERPDTGASWRGRDRTSNLRIQSPAFCQLNYPPLTNHA